LTTDPPETERKARRDALLLKLPGVSTRKIRGLDAYVVSDKMFACISGRGLGGRQSSFNDALDHFESTSERESGILVNVHSAERLERLVWFAPSSLSNTVRMNRNNLLGHHN